MNFNKIGFFLVVTFSAWCIHRALTTGLFADYMMPATLAVLLGGVFVYNLGGSGGSDDRR